MSYFQRDKFILQSVQVPESVPINPALSRVSQFARWLDALSPRNCYRHARTRLVVDRKASERESLRGENSDCWYRRHMTPGCEVPDREAREKLYAFDAIFRCPACRVAYARCPPEFHETSFETFDTSAPELAAALAKARAFVAQVNTHRRGFALFVGLPGTGKTRLACNIIRELKEGDALYVRQGELTNALRATYGHKDVVLHRSQRQYDDDEEPPDDDRPEPLKIAQNVGFLALDEIGCLPLANDERLLLDELLKHRFEQGKPTVLISNLPLTGTPETLGLKEFLGDALTDRIKAATGNGKFIVQFNGESYRRTRGQDYPDGSA